MALIAEILRLTVHMMAEVAVQIRSVMDGIMRIGFLACGPLGDFCGTDMTRKTLPRAQRLG